MGRGMAQAVRHRPLTAEVRVSPCGIYGGQSGTGTVFFSEFFSFTLSISFHRGCPCSYIIRGTNNRPVGGRSSETVAVH
jgi:hypothetical protein